LIYYRIAWKNDQSSLWQWRSTTLTSPGAVFYWLWLCRAVPQDHLRVFSSSSCEHLKELLADENKGGPHHSATAEQFLHEWSIHSGKMAGGASERSESGTRANQEQKTITATLAPLVNQGSIQDASVDEKLISTLDRRRWEREMGAGGDHDLPYTFALPLSLPQTLAWIRLMARVQRGELGLSVQVLPNS
jgi:hypothetical protein